MAGFNGESDSVIGGVGFAYEAERSTHEVELLLVDSILLALQTFALAKESDEVCLSFRALFL